MNEETELAWAAGLFDGEGSAYARYNNSHYVRKDGVRSIYPGRYKYPKLTLSQNIGVEPSPLIAFQMGRYSAGSNVLVLS